MNRAITLMQLLRGFRALPKRPGPAINSPIEIGHQFFRTEVIKGRWKPDSNTSGKWVMV